MGIDATKQGEGKKMAKSTNEAIENQGSDSASPVPPQRRFGLGNFSLQDLSEGLRTLRWGIVLLLGLGAGLLMPLTLAQAGVLSFFAGIIPVGAGLILGRRVKSNYILHGLVTGVIAAITSLIFLAILLFFTPLGTTSQSSFTGGETSNLTLEQLWLQLGSFISFSLLIFTTFGASMSGRTEERNRAMREQLAERGGQLERPGSVRTVDDLRGLSLPQFGSYVNALFKKQGFTFKDYRFIDKDKHLDLWLEHDGEPWHLRLTVADKVNPGTVESLYQAMKEEGSRKGVVVTSTEFIPSAQKSAKGRPIVLIDGETLFQIAEG